MASLKLDENLPGEATDLLNAAGHDVLAVLDQSLGGRADSDIAAICRSEGRTLITFDLDFADIRAYPPADYPGLIVLRLRSQSIPHTVSVLRNLAVKLDAEPLDGKLWIVSESAVRISG